MEKLKRFFRRHRKADAVQAPPVAAAPPVKRPRTPGEPAIVMDDAAQDFESPRKKSRRDTHPDSTLDRLHSRTDSHAGSIGSTATAPVPPKLEWLPNPAGGELSGIFEKLSTEPAARAAAPQQQQQQQLRPYGTMPSRGQSSSRHSLPAAAIFARGLKRYYEDMPEREASVTTTTAAAESTNSSAPARESSVAGEDRPATSSEPVVRAPIRDSMTLDDILNQPLFGNKTATSDHEGEQQQKQQRFFSHLASDGTLTSISTPLPAGKQADEPPPQLEPAKPKRHPLIP